MTDIDNSNFFNTGMTDSIQGVIDTSCVEESAAEVQTTVNYLTQAAYNAFARAETDSANFGTTTDIELEGKAVVATTRDQNGKVTSKTTYYSEDGSKYEQISYNSKGQVTGITYQGIAPDHQLCQGSYIKGYETYLVSEAEKDEDGNITKPAEYATRPTGLAYYQEGSTKISSYTGYDKQGNITYKTEYEYKNSTREGIVTIPDGGSYTPYKTGYKNSIIKVLDKQGNIAEIHNYDKYGKLLNTTDKDGNIIKRYNGASETTYSYIPVSQLDGQYLYYIR